MVDNILVFGSAFNPVHYGHLQPLEEVNSRKKFDKVLLVPSSKSREDKNILIEDSHRVAMLRLAVQDRNDFMIDTMEVDKPVWYKYTYYTMKYLKEKYIGSQLYFMLGSDILNALPDWQLGEDLVKENRFVVMERPGFEINRIISESAFLQKYEDHFTPIYNSIKINISSTMIRDKIKYGLSTKYLLPDSVRDYISEHKLYL